MSKNLGFTMAEILLSLTIIGVVAAITLPSLMANINERTWNTQRKALYARMSQAIAMMPQVGGYGNVAEDADGNVTADTAAETFLTEGLSKVLKINNICDNEHLADCGISGTITTIHGDVVSAFPATFQDLNESFMGYDYTYSNGSRVSYSQINTKAAAFETQNGESIALYYSPTCSSLDFASLGSGNITTAQSYVCANFIYDLNGSRGPNTIGKDIGFITAVNSTDSYVVAPMPVKSSFGKLTHANALTACKSLMPDARLASLPEMIGLFANRKFWYKDSDEIAHWASQKAMYGNSELARYFNMNSGHSSGTYATYTRLVQCVER